MTVQDYLNLVTSEYQNSTNFLEMISVDVGVPVQVQTLLNSMLNIFDLSQSPVGNQLDILGQWVGISRNLSVPIPSSGIYFTWDDTASDGWDSGTWSTTGAPTQIVTLPDDAYLSLILSTIAENSWDGTTQGFYTILQNAFPQYTFLLDDNQNMTYSLGIIGNPIDSLTLALITGGYIPMRPEGVEVLGYFINNDSNPFFAWDDETTNLAGWDTGSWAIFLEPT